MTESTEKNPLATLYGQEYMGKIFYYCLRKTGDSHEAEDLASDITLQVLTALFWPMQTFMPTVCRSQASAISMKSGMSTAV